MPVPPAVSPTTVLRRHFRRISAMPCWHVVAEYGSWIDFHFGEPALRIQEPNPDVRWRWKRRVFVEGRHRLWVEMCDWRMIEDSGRRYHSEQRRWLLRQAAARLDGQALIGLSISLRPLRCAFVFDGGGQLLLQRYPRAEPDWHLWHLYSGRSYLALRSDRSLEFGTVGPRGRLRRCPVSAVELAI